VGGSAYRSALVGMLSARAGSAEGGRRLSSFGSLGDHLEQELRADLGQRHIADFIEYGHVAAQPTRQHTLHRIVLPGFDRT